MRETHRDQGFEDFAHFVFSARERLKVRNWPQDSDFQLVSLAPGETQARVVWTEHLADDIAAALEALRAAGVSITEAGWCKRLTVCL